MPKSKHRSNRMWWATRIAAAALLLVLADYALYQYVSPVGGRSHDMGCNGVWMRYPWYFGKYSDADIERSAREMRRNNIRYAFYHVRSIGTDGRLKYHYAAEARRLVAAVHREAPDIRVVAWIFAGNRESLGEIADISRPEIRRAMVAETLWLVHEAGFDGVQWDYEICADGDGNFLKLMRETHAALPREKLLSAAVPLLNPFSAPRRYGWSAPYLARVARHTDQIAVMGYDSGMILPRAYVWLMRRQARDLPRIVIRANPRCRVLIGIPSYGHAGASHNPRAENLRLALKGIREGLDPDPITFEGVAIFADYTTSPSEWRTFRHLWVKPHSF